MNEENEQEIKPNPVPRHKQIEWTVLAIGTLALIIITICMIAFADDPIAPPMTPREALAIVDRASADYQGTRADHVQIQRALQVLAQMVEARAAAPLGPEPPEKGDEQ